MLHKLWQHFSSDAANSIVFRRVNFGLYSCCHEKYWTRTRNAQTRMILLFASTVILDGSISYTLDSFISSGVTGGL